MRYLVAFFLLLLVPSLAHAQAARILLDGFFDDWETLDPAHADSSGDAPTGAIDFARDRGFILFSRGAIENTDLLVAANTSRL